MSWEPSLHDGLEQLLSFLVIFEVSQVDIEDAQQFLQLFLVSFHTAGVDFGNGFNDELTEGSCEGLSRS